MKCVLAIVAVLSLISATRAGNPPGLLSVSLVPGSPNGIIGVDVHVDVGDEDTWTAAGIRALAFNGAALRYAAQQEEMRVVPDITSPGLGDLFVCSISKPLTTNSRFTNGGAAIAGRYSPTGPTETLSASEFNVAYFASPPANVNSPSVDGYIARLGLDVSGLGLANPAFQIFTPGSQPAGWIPVLLSEPPEALRGFSPGSVFATFDNPNIRGINWGVYAMGGDGQVIPLPSGAAMGLAGLAAAVGIRRRR